MNSYRRRLTQVAALLLVHGSIAQSAAGADAVFSRVSVAKFAGMSKQGELIVAPSNLVLAFGLPTEEPWDTESFGAFYFHGPGEEVFAVYYRAYDSPNTRELRKSFWARATTAEFSIGAKNEARVPEFRAWLGAAAALRTRHACTHSPTRPPQVGPN